MKIESAVLSLLLTSSTAFTPSQPRILASQSPLFSVVEPVVDKDKTEAKVVEDGVEEKAWKIIKEQTDEKEVEASSNSTVAEKEAIVVEEATVEEATVEEVVEVPETKTDTPEEPILNLSEDDLVQAIEQEAQSIVDEMTDDECEIDDEGNPADEICVDESKRTKVKNTLRNIMVKTLGLVRTGGDDEASVLKEGNEFSIIDMEGDVPEGELLERGWEERGNSNALRRNAEVWKFALSCVFKALKPKKLRKKGATEEEIMQAKTEAAEFIRNGLLKLGPSFVKLVSMSEYRTTAVASLIQTHCEFE